MVSENPVNSGLAREGPAMELWDLGRRHLLLGHRPRIMGILNVTPDSFSDGGKHFDSGLAVEAALRMETEGADIIDIGGESTRPYSDVVSAEEEWRRVIPVIKSLRPQLRIPISIDTSKASVAADAIDAGAEIVNDVTGLEGDPDMPALVASRQVGVCVMHMQGTPQTMQDSPAYDDVVAEVHAYLAARLRYCLDLGIAKERICLDPGIGFGKTHQHNLLLLRNIRRFFDIGCPLLVGHSRKGFIGQVLGDKDADRTAATLGVSLALAAAGVHVLRVHDVRQTVEALKLFEAAGALGP